ncbi:MAG: oligosaccharide flippase family protein [Myxococcota bacterium]|nr:oligosaccharide flippase family protein [Myxococcota bacterium]
MPPVQGSVARSMAWVGAASSVVAVCDLIALAVILQRWATATEYGTVSIVITMFGALQLVGEAGLPAALVQRRDVDEDRLSTMYWLGLLFGAALYAVIWIVSPWFAALYDLPILQPLLRSLGLLVVIRPLYTTQQGMFRRELRFRELSVARIVANVLELAVKLGVAVAGGGVWAFVFGPLVRELTYAIAIPLFVKFRPRRVCRPRMLREDFRFGVRATGGELLFQIYSNLDYQIVAYTFGPAALGVYRAAFELVLEPVRFVSGVVTVVAFPAFARLRSDRPALIRQFVAFTRQNLTVVLALVGVIVLCAEELLLLAFGASYATAATAARILAVVGVFRALSHLGPPLLDGVGRPDLSLRYHALAAVVLATGFGIAAAVGTTFVAIAVAWAIAYPIAFLVLGGMVLAQLELPLGTYVRQVGRIAAWIAIATVIGAIVHQVTAGAGPVLRLAATSVVLLGVATGLLARYERMPIQLRPPRAPGAGGS